MLKSKVFLLFSCGATAPVELEKLHGLTDATRARKLEPCRGLNLSNIDTTSMADVT